MPSIYSLIAFWSWPVLFVVWILGYIGLKRTTKRPQVGTYLITTVLIALGFWLLYTENLSGALTVAVTPQNDFFGILGAALAVLGVAFAIWARVTLGRNWSGSVATVKEDHQLIQRGPYAIVRHPIYTGFFFAMLGTALTLGQLNRYLGVIVAVIAFAWRIKIEEQVMTQEFPQAYPEFKKRTKTFIPFVW